MASTYENDLRLEEMATGENSGSWGTKTNTNLELIADAFSYGTETIADGDTSIEIQDGTADAARSLALKINSSTNLTAIRVVTLAPNTTSKVWIIQNATTSSSSYPLRISAGSGTKVDIATGTTKIIATDGIGAGSNVVELTQDIAIADMIVDGTLTLDGGDGAVDFAAAGSVKFVDNNAAALVFEEANNAYMTFVTTDGSEAVKFDKALDINADLDIDSNIQLDGTFTVGVDGTGYDVKFFGAAASAYMLWDQSTDDLILGGAAQMGIGSATPYTALDVTHATTNQVAIFRSGDTTATIGFADDTTPLTSNLSVVTLGAEGSSMVFNTNSGRSMTIDSSRRVLIGTETARGDFFNTVATAFLQVEGTTANSAAASIVRNSADDNGPQLILGKSNGTAVGSDTIVTDDALLGRISFQGADGSDLVEGARIEGLADGTPLLNDMPGRLTFYTTADGAASPSERMRIDQAGRVGINAVPTDYNDYGDGLVVRKSSITGSSGITVQATNASGYSSLYFGDPDDTKVGGLEYFHTTNAMTISSGNATTMVLDGSQRVLIGATASRTVQGFATSLQVEGTAATDSSVQIVRNSNDINPPYINFGKTRGSVGGVTAVSNNDILGEISWGGADGNDLNNVSATIQGVAEATATNNDTPGRLVFKTTASGAGASTERMRITSQGIVEMYGNSSSTLHLKSSSPILAFTDTNSFPDANDRFQIRGTSSDGIAAGSMGFYDSSADTTNIYFTIRDDGKIGIRNTTPTALGLQVGGDPSGTVAPSMSISLQDGGGTNTSLAIRGGSPTIFFDQTGGGNGKFLMDSADIAFKSGSMQSEGSEIARIRWQGGITFNGDTAEANALNDYEEGTWTPTGFTGGTLYNATYTKVGRLVTANMYVNATTFNSSTMGGLPFASITGWQAGTLGLNDSTNANACEVSTVSTNINFRQGATSVTPNGSGLMVSVTYNAA